MTDRDRFGFSTERFGRRSVGVMFVIILAVTLGAATGTAAADAPDCSTVSYNGDGTEANPYEVSNVDQLQCIESQGLDASYELVSDIDASETSAWNAGKGFDPIGKSTFQGGPPFTGTFDGNGHTVTGLTITRGSENNVGLFGGTGSGSSIENINLRQVDIIGGSPSVGALVGSSTGGGVTGASASGSINAQDFVGGLIGFTEGTVTQSSADVRVTAASSDVGGLIGEVSGGSVSQSFATGNVDGGGGEVGGLVGDVSSASVTDSYARGDADGNFDVGGLIGASNSGTVTRSYSTGSVTADFSDDAGGLIGDSFSGSVVTDSYWDTQASGRTSSEGGTGLTTNEMTGDRAPANMNGFSFNNPDTWETVTDPDDYPVLAWQTDSGNIAPTADFTFSPTSPETGETVTFDASGSIDDGSIERYDWDFDGDGTTDETTTSPTTTHTYTNAGTFDASVTVTDDGGRTDTATQTVSVDPSSSGTIDNIQTSLPDTDGDDLPDQVQVDVTVSDVGTGQTTVELGESDFDVDVSPTNTGQAQFVTPQDTDGDGTNEAVEFVGLGSVSTTYTVVADLSNQADGDTGTVTVELGGGATSSTTYTVEEATGPLDPNNPFGDSGNNPVDRSTVINRVVEWNLNGEINGTSYTRQEIIDFVVEWNLAS
jgi:PKD repeat protein